MSEKKNLAYYVQRVLKEHTDGQHPATRQKIAELLLSEYGKKCDPRSISSALEWLIAIGAPIRYETRLVAGREKKTAWRWQEQRDEALSSAVAFSLITSPYLEDSTLKSVQERYPELFGDEHLFCDSPRQNATLPTQNIIKSINAINNAICDNNMLLFSVFNYKSDTRNHYLESSGRIREYLVKPIKTVFLYGTVYLFCELGDTDMYRFFPIHRLHNLRSAGIKFTAPPSFDIPLPSSRTEAEYMLSVQRERAVLKIKTERLGEFCEGFGGEYRVICSYAGLTEVELYTELRSLKGLILKFGADIEAMSPTKLRRAVATELQGAASKYSDMRRYHGTK